MVSTRTSVGSIGILANHQPLLAMLDPTELRLYKSETEVVRFAQGEGYLQVTGNARARARRGGVRGRRARRVRAARAAQARRGGARRAPRRAPRRRASPRATSAAGRPSWRSCAAPRPEASARRPAQPGPGTGLGGPRARSSLPPAGLDAGDRARADDLGGERVQVLATAVVEAVVVGTQDTRRCTGIDAARAVGERLAGQHRGQLASRTLDVRGRGLPLRETDSLAARVRHGWSPCRLPRRILSCRRYPPGGGRTRSRRAPDHLRHLATSTGCAPPPGSSRAGSRRARSTSTRPPVRRACSRSPPRSGPPDGPTLVFHGHSTSSRRAPEQFTPRVEGDRLIGRGAYDMKGGLAAMMCALHDLRRPGRRARALRLRARRGVRGDRRAHDATTLVKARLRRRLRDHRRADRTCTSASRPRACWRCGSIVRGHAAHGSTPWLGDNAVLKAIDVFRRIESMPFTRESSELFDRPVDQPRPDRRAATRPTRSPTTAPWTSTSATCPSQDPGEHPRADPRDPRRRRRADVHLAARARLAARTRTCARCARPSRALDRRRVDERRARRRLRRGRRSSRRASPPSSSGPRAAATTAPRSGSRSTSLARYRQRAGRLRARACPARLVAGRGRRRPARGRRAARHEATDERLPRPGSARLSSAPARGAC